MTGPPQFCPVSEELLPDFCRCRTRKPRRPATLDRVGDEDYPASLIADGPPDPEAIDADE